MNSDYPKVEISTKHDDDDSSCASGITSVTMINEQSSEQSEAGKMTISKDCFNELATEAHKMKSTHKLMKHQLYDLRASIVEISLKCLQLDTQTGDLKETTDRLLEIGDKLYKNIIYSYDDRSSENFSDGKKVSSKPVEQQAFSQSSKKLSSDCVPQQVSQLDHLIREFKQKCDQATEFLQANQLQLKEPTEDLEKMLTNIAPFAGDEDFRNGRQFLEQFEATYAFMMDEDLGKALSFRQLLCEGEATKWAKYEPYDTSYATLRTYFILRHWNSVCQSRVYMKFLLSSFDSQDFSCFSDYISYWVNQLRGITIAEEPQLIQLFIRKLPEGLKEKFVCQEEPKTLEKFRKICLQELLPLEYEK